MYNTEAIILKKIDSGEADAVFTIYTKDFGKMRALAQGIRKEAAKLKGHLEPFNLASVGFVLGKNGARLTRAATLNHWPSIRSDWQKLKTAYAIMDAVDAETMQGERDDKLWGMISEKLKELERNSYHEKFLQEFKAELATVLGNQ